MRNCLSGLSARNISGDIFEITISGYGLAVVGPYSELKRYLGGGSGLEVHHIVAVEHLRMAHTSYSESNAPSIAISSALHATLSARIGGEQKYLGGRPRIGGDNTGSNKFAASKYEIAELYRQIYTNHTHFHELFAIAKRILRT